MAKKRPVLTDEQREQRRAEQRELVIASIEQLRTSDGWRAHLNARARFRSYSARNVLLILSQRTMAHCLLGEGEIEHPVQRGQIRRVGRRFAGGRACWWRWIGSVGLVVS